MLETNPISNGEKKKKKGSLLFLAFSALQRAKQKTKKKIKCPPEGQKKKKSNYCYKQKH